MTGERRKQPGSEVVEIGLQAARDTVDLAVGVLDELLEGFERARHRGGELVDYAIGDRRQATSSTSDTGSGSSAETDGDVVEQVTALAYKLIDVLGGVAGQLLDIGLSPLQGGSVARPESSAEDTWVQLGAVQAGSKGHAMVEVDNRSERSAEIALSVSNPLASLRSTIPRKKVTFEPEAIEIGAKETEKVRVTVKVPADTPPGEYLGIIRSDQAPALRAILRLEVI